MHSASDPRMPAGYPASRVPPQPVVGMSTDDNTEDSLPLPLTLQPLSLDVSLLSGSEAYYVGEGINTDPSVQRQEGSVSASTDSSLPMPLTRPSLDDSLMSGFNAEIRYEAHRYKKSENDVVAAPAEVDDEDWPLDPNLTCPYCKVVFWRGQIQEYRLHTDKCQL